MGFARRLASVRTLALCTLIFALLTWFYYSPQHVSDDSDLDRPQPRFHLLLPASSSNKNFCRLLLSAKLLNYPVPVLVNWGAAETSDPYDMHLLKIQKVLDYLRSFPADQQEDLVLMVDAYDVWFQLPPEVLIRRYFEQKRNDEVLLNAKYGREVIQESDYRNTVYFSNDKACWPDDEENPRAACWAVPGSPLPRHSYGPTTDETYFEAKNSSAPYQTRPRWLNSGSVMGPVRDVKKMYETVAAFLKAHAHGKSDQFYFAEIWGMQEYARTLQDPDATFPDAEPPDIEGTLGPVENAEFHMTLDYENLLFQPIGYFDPFLSFVQFDGSLDSGRPEGAPIPYSDIQTLADDVREAHPALSAMSMSKVKDGQGTRMRTWPELPLLTNLVTKHTTPIIHFMLEKEYRVKWWDRMWYAPFAKDLFEAVMAADEVPIMTRPLDGQVWKNAEQPVVDTMVDPNGKRDGAWSDKGSWLSWSLLCQGHEDYIYGADRRDSYSPEG